MLLTGVALAGYPPELQLCRAAAQGDLAGVRRQIAAGADVNAMGRARLDEPVSDEGMFWRVLGSIATGGLIIPLLVEIDRPQYASYHALSCALGAAEPRREVVAALLDAGANPEHPQPGAALGAYLAVHRDDADAADWYRWLRSRGASSGEALTALLVEDRPLGTPLSPLVEALLADGAASPVCDAAWKGDLAMLARLDPDPRTVACRDGEDPTTLLNLAAQADRVETARWLLDHGADPNAVPPSEPTGRKGIFKKKFTYGASPMISAVHAGDPALVGLLHARGASALTLDTNGNDALYYARWQPAVLPAVLDTLPNGTAMVWALNFQDPTQPEAMAAVRGWLPATLLPLLAVPERAPTVRALRAEWWGEAMAHTPMDTIVTVLASSPGARADDLRLDRNPCLPQAGQTRAEVRARWGKPTTTERDTDALLPPPGTRRSLLGRAPQAPTALRVHYEDRRVSWVSVSDAGALRAAGCDAPVLRALELPAWRRAWELGPHDEESARYGLPSNGAWANAWLDDGAITLLDPRS